MCCAQPALCLSPSAIPLRRLVRAGAAEQIAERFRCGQITLQHTESEENTDRSPYRHLAELVLAAVETYRPIPRAAAG